MILQTPILSCRRCPGIGGLWRAHQGYWNGCGEKRKRSTGTCLHGRPCERSLKMLMRAKGKRTCLQLSSFTSFPFGYQGTSTVYLGQCTRGGILWAISTASITICPERGFLCFRRDTDAEVVESSGAPADNPGKAWLKFEKKPHLSPSPPNPPTKGLRGEREKHQPRFICSGLINKVRADPDRTPTLDCDYNRGAATATRTATPTKTQTPAPRAPPATRPATATRKRQPRRKHLRDV